uniref:Reverse transcriptase zinc-binding domain-containing protein n=1 Tax=Tanacetum cinerariifolium TaxID=118510 RepID=A0A6L2J740_TANCI|nr:hypothetical protein [Tanacetum cinerariifolium]
MEVVIDRKIGTLKRNCIRVYGVRDGRGRREAKLGRNQVNHNITWNKILPTKVNIFTWRAVRGMLPAREAFKVWDKCSRGGDASG